MFNLTAYLTKATKCVRTWVENFFESPSHEPFISQREGI